MIWRPTVLLALVAVATASGLPESSGNCQGCRAIVSYARQFNSSTQREEYRELFKGFCEHYYPASTDFQQGPCPMFVEGLFYVLDNTDPVHHCDQIGACGPTAQPSDDIYDYLQASQDIASVRNADGAICDFCVNMVEQVKASLSNPTTVQILKDKTEIFCDYLAVIGQDKQCKQIIDKYLTQATILIKYLDSKAYCRSISMCPQALRVAISREPARTLPTLADFNNFGLETSVVVGARPAIRRANGECVLCKTMVKEMFHFLRENKTEANIMQGLDRVCHLLYPRGGAGLSQCQELVHAYTRELVQLLVDETDPDMICMLLGLCTYEPLPSTARGLPAGPIESSKKLVRDPSLDFKTLIAALEPTVPVEEGRTCLECKMFFAYLKDTIQNPKSQEEVKDWLLTNLCNQLPGNLANTCTNMIQTYAPVFFEALKGDLDPQAACAKLNVCSARVQVLQLDSFASLSPMEPSGTQTNNKVCDTCVGVVTRVDDYLSSHSASQDVSTLTKVCDNIKRPLWRRECADLIKLYGLEIITRIPTMANPHELCNQIKLC